MWKAQVGHQLPQVSSQDDDWETDPDYINDVTEQEQRWGSKTSEGSGKGTKDLNINDLREQVVKDDAAAKRRELEEGPKASYGYGGKFGVQQDRKDKSAMGHDYIGKVEKHASQKDYSTGFGGKFGLEKDRQDKSAHGFEFREKVEKHESQKDYSSGFGGKFGVQTDRVDGSAMGWDYQHKLEQHESQKDYSKGFGGKYGLQTDRIDKSALGWDYKEKQLKHCSQTDYTSGFGGKFGVQSDRQDKSALGWDHHEQLSKHESQKDYSVGFGGKFGVQKDRQDSSAGGWDEVMKVQAHPSQVDMKKGFGGKFGLETDRVDKSAHTFSDVQKPSAYQKTKPEITSSSKNLRAKFEQLASSAEDESRKQIDEERKLRVVRDKREQAESKKVEEERQRSLKNERDAKNQMNATVAEDKLPQPAVRKRLSEGSLTPKEEKVISIPSSTDDDFENVSTTEHVEEQTVVSDVTSTSPAEDKQEQSTNDYDDSVFAQDQNLYDQVDVCSGLTAVALYDYQAAAEDEISFDPEETITNIEMIDEGWWRGACRGKTGLFPANYVQLQQEAQ